MGALALFGIRNLPRKYRLKFLFGHSRTRQHTLTLNICSCGNHKDQINGVCAASFKQQRNIKDHGFAARLSVLFGEGMTGCGDQWMDDGFKFFQCVLLAKNHRREKRPVNFTISG